MNIVRKAIVIIISIFSICSYGRSSSNWKWFYDSQVTFSYPSSIYEAPEIRSYRSINNLNTFEVIDIRKKGQDIVDSLSVCNDGMENCALRNGFDKPYWIEEASGRLVIFDPTERLFPYVTKFGSGYEAFPTCAWVDSRGISSQYGGQCYVAVITNGKKTISLNSVVGPNIGIYRLKEVYKTQLNLYRKIIQSAE